MHWRQKPAGWPEYMVSKTLSRGRVGYYWQPPTWSRETGMPAAVGSSWDRLCQS